MNRPIEDQLRNYFTHVDQAQGAVEVPTIRGRSAPDQAATTERHDAELELIVLDQDRTTTISPDRSRRNWLLVSAAAAAIVALVGGLFVIARDDTEPTVPADSTSVATQPPATTSTTSTTPDLAANPLPFPGGTAEPGRVATSQLGVEVAFDIPVPMSLTIGRDNQLEIFAFADPVERTDLDRGFGMYRVAGLRTRAESSTPFGEASIDPLDIDRWITESGVVVLDDREIDVDNRAARVLDILASPDALDAQPADCPPDLRPCSFWAAFSGGVANPGGWISAQTPVRLYMIPIGDQDPLAIVSYGLQNDEWDDFFESTVIPTMEIGADAPPAGTS
jgi:hypothetical protein